MTSSKIPFFLVALCTLGGSQIPLSKGMEVKGLGKYLADNRKIQTFSCYRELFEDSQPTPSPESI
ncbi:hypothetical protein PGT21_003312 [Puccinia graminis f. sp. tritici]|uniref:Uncharacterized protein n=1 Tax=Puccinia graminis f. sp. tritici TaxID=56615 RepID=A0A5B0NID5_PUCGR|nr:hypothetical protein PGT21_003312 [Puccinia graminis f. sp. tritici]